ncbi:MAG: NADH-quinone oxidoreductase subunit J [Vicinamibacterales bacterium]|nr:NADH-quinone oxidoreductase subunit J [Vicinamibacterales bacterium]
MAHNLVFFYGFAALAVVSTLLVIAQPNPIYSVLLLILSFVALAGLYVMLDAPFVAVTQIIVYAGAIMVLFLFVVMLLNVSHEHAVADNQAASDGGGPTVRWFGAILAGVMAVELVWALNRSRSVGAALAGAERETAWSVEEIGRILFTRYGFAFEATSVLILVAMVGSIALAGRHLSGKKAWRR